MKKKVAGKPAAKTMKKAAGKPRAMMKKRVAGATKPRAAASMKKSGTSKKSVGEKAGEMKAASESSSPVLYVPKFMQTGGWERDLHDPAEELGVFATAKEANDRLMERVEDYFGGDKQGKCILSKHKRGTLRTNRDGCIKRFTVADVGDVEAYDLWVTAYRLRDGDDPESNGEYSDYYGDSD